MFKQICLYILVGAIGAAVGRWAAPEKKVDVEHTVYKDRVVEKIVYKTSTTKKDNTITIRTETISPDGTRKIETKTVDKDEVDVVQHTDDTKTDTKKEDVSKSSTTTYKNDVTLISLGLKSPYNSINPSYGLLVNKQVLGPFTLGVMGWMDGSVGVSVGVMF